MLIDYPMITSETNSSPFSPSFIRLQRKGEDSLTSYPLAAFEQLFHLRYQPFLAVSSKNELEILLKQCPYLLRSSQIAQKNYSLTQKYKQPLCKAALAPVYLKWVNPLVEYGLFADEDLSSGVFVGEYTGMIRHLPKRERQSNPYCFHYPTKWWSFNYYAIDAANEGNLMRFINHSHTPNLKVICLTKDHLLHMVFITSELVSKNTQLTFNYQQ